MCLLRSKKESFCNHEIVAILRKEYEERVIQIKRVSKKTKGGNKIGFTALVVIGNKKGKVGIGLGKSESVASAIRKAIQRAKDSVVEIDLKGNILLRPAPEGSGIIAGGSVRDVVELVGLKDISAKMLGSNNKNNNVKCAIQALEMLRF